MGILFKAKTQEGYTVKILAELLQHNIKTACFVVTKETIVLRIMDTHKKILIDLSLFSQNFSIYKFNKETLFLGINLNHFHKMLKSIKKKDSIVFFIKDDKPKDLGIKILPKENNRITISYIKIQSIQNIDIGLPEGYNKPIIVPSNEYQKMCKDMNNINNIITVNSKDWFIKFLCNAGSVYSREVVFGELDEDEEEEERHDEEDAYNEDFDTEQLVRIIKISGLSNILQIYVANNLPLLFKSKVGDLGNISIFIKSKKQLEEEEYNINSSDED